MLDDAADQPSQVLLQVLLAHLELYTPISVPFGSMCSSVYRSMAVTSTLSLPNDCQGQAIITWLLWIALTSIAAQRQQLLPRQPE